MVKNPSAKLGDAGSIPGSGRSPGGGNGNLFQNSCPENPMDRGAWQDTVHGVGHNFATEQSHARFTYNDATLESFSSHTFKSQTYF